MTKELKILELITEVEMLRAVIGYLTTYILISPEWEEKEECIKYITEFYKRYKQCL